MGTSVIDNESFMRIQQGTSMVCVKFRGRHWAWTQNDAMLKHRGLARGGPMSRPSSQGIHTDIHGNHVVRGLWGKRRSFPRLALAEPDYKEKLAQLSSEKRSEVPWGFRGVNRELQPRVDYEIGWLGLSSLQEGIALVKPDDQVFTR